VRCLWCHKSWSTEWRLCPACGAQLDPEDGPDAVPEFRAVGQEPFTRTSTFELFETGGGTLAVCWREDLVLGHHLDKRWCVSLYTDTRALPRMALVALPLVCLILFGRPARVIPAHDRDAGDAPSGRFDVLDLFG